MSDDHNHETYEEAINTISSELVDYLQHKYPNAEESHDLSIMLAGVLLTLSARYASMAGEDPIAWFEKQVAINKADAATRDDAYKRFSNAINN